MRFTNMKRAFAAWTQARRAPPPKRAERTLDFLDHCRAVGEISRIWG